MALKSNRVALITCVDPTDGRASRHRRLAQMIHFYVGMGLRIDVITVGTEDLAASGLPTELQEIERLARLRQHWPNGAENRPDNPVSMMLAQMADGAPYAIVHLDQVLMPVDRDLARHWILDCDEERATSPMAGSVDLALSNTDNTRSIAAQTGVEAVRLPLHLWSEGTVAGTMIGWPDMSDRYQIRAWDAFLKRLSWRGLELPHVLLLAGPECDACTTPPAMMRRTLKRKDAHPEVAAWALGLAIHPGDRLDSDYGPINSLLARNCPVLLRASASEVFEGRWKLPVADTLDELVDLAIGWSTGTLHETFADATEATVQAFQEDVMSMTLHVGERVFAMLEDGTS